MTPTKTTVTKKPAPAKKVAKPAQKKAAEPVVAATPVVAAPAEPVVAEAAATPIATETPAKVHRTFEEVIDGCVKQAQENITSNRTLVSSIREARKIHDREMREAQKNSKRSRKQKNGVKKPLTGFAKPCLISDQLADFLKNDAGNEDVSRGMEMSRTEVTRRLNDYFVKNDLRDVEDKRTILYKKDPKLVALLGKNVQEGGKLTYFNLQSALKDKFIKTPVSDTASSAAAPAASTTA